MPDPAAMSQRCTLVFVCAHLTDERLYAAQVAALESEYYCLVLAFREETSLAAMAASLLERAPPRFTLIGLSLGGYVAFEVIRTRPERVERLVLIDTTAVADHPARRAGRFADIEKVKAGGIDALIPELPARWMHPDHAPRLAPLMGDMARSIGARGQLNQQTAMLARPDSHADLERVTVPALVVCGRQDPVTPLQDHEAMQARMPHSRLAVIEHCGHLSTIEQPAAVTRVLADWLRETQPGTAAA